MTEAHYISDLLDGKRIASSKIPKKVLNTLINERLVLVSVHGSRKTIRALNTDDLKQYLVDNDERFRILEPQSKATRAAQASSTGNSKLVKVRSCPGFPVNSFEPIECTINGQSLIVNPIEGTFVFISDWKMFSVPEDVIVVGIENMENFRLVRRQVELFKSVLGDSRVIFVSRYPQSTDLRNWLKSIPNKYVHFGDFDLSGIKIFQTEFERHLRGRASYLIPSDIEERIKNGSSKRYDDQLNYVGNISSNNIELQNLINIINQERKGYDQEGYII